MALAKVTLTRRTPDTPEAATQRSPPSEFPVRRLVFRELGLVDEPTVAPLSLDRELWQK